MACKTAFGNLLVTNSFRGIVAEAVVASALDQKWLWCSADYAGWDFERSDGMRLEVKQSAARQTWRRSDGRPSVCSFDIRARKGRYEGADWFDEPGRNADIYVFAHHYVDDDAADHCDPAQWAFYVISTMALPASQTIGLRALSKLAQPSSYSELSDQIEAVAKELVPHRAKIGRKPTAD